jgi:5'-deoxynucleotidase YfbR-like HD superfamily hydrolase
VGKLNLGPREEELSKIKRFMGDGGYDIMFYRTNVLLHSQRVSWMVEELKDYILKINPNFDIVYAVAFAKLHDDAEIVTGDVQYGLKLKMSPEELQQINNNEEKAISILIEHYGKFQGNFVYEDILKAALNPTFLEAQFVKYLDKIDAICESLHELHAGNNLFLKPYLNLKDALISMPERLPELRSLIPGKHSLLYLPKELNVEKIIKEGMPYDEKSINYRSSCKIYNKWKEITICHAGIEALTDKKE